MTYVDRVRSNSVPCYASLVALTKYGPKEELSPSIGDLCPICGVPFKAGDFTALIRTTTHSKHGDRRVEVRWDCATKPAA